MYRCERCGKTFSRFKTPGQCPHCMVFASVRCSDCGFTAPSSRFTAAGNICPQCGSGVEVPGGGTPGRASAPASSEEPCKGCGRTIAATDWTCPHCGRTQWLLVIFTTLVGLFGIGAAIAPGSPVWLRIIGGLFGLAFFVGIGEIWTGLRSKSGDKSTAAAESKPAGEPSLTNANVLQPSESRRERSRPGRAAIALVVVAVAGGILGLIWISQLSGIREETSALQADVNAAEFRLTGLRTDVADLDDDIAALEEQVAAARAEAAGLDDDAAAIEAAVAARTAEFDLATADEVALAATLAEHEQLLLDLAELDGDVARALAVVDATFALGVSAGNQRDLGNLEAAIAVESLETLLGELEAAIGALEDAAARIAGLPEALSTFGEGTDG